MTDNKFWNEDWLNTQRQYWEQWTDLQQQALGVKQPAASPWEQAMEHWWGAVQGAMPDYGQSFYTKMMDQGKSFFRMAEETMQASSGKENATDAWAHILSGLTDSFHKAGSNDLFNKTTAFWEMPLDNWNRMASAMSPVPGDTLRGMPHADVRNHLDRLLGAPGLGYTREGQAQYQSLAQAAMEYQEALAEYALFFSSMGEKAGALLQERLADTPVESARQLYDAWVGCCEEVYAVEVMKEDYSKLHGRLVNALMVLKSRWGEVLNEYLSAMNIPTRDDIRTLQLRVQEQRRENKLLRAEVDALRKVVEESRRAPTKPAAKRAVKKKKATRKKSTPRKKKSTTTRR
jgi:class III poly(R)-hydroxyalkanoic acid synthase PhaE subunit